MEHILQYIIAIAMIMTFGVPTAAFVFRIVRDVRRESTALRRGFELGARGVEMLEYPDSLEGFVMYQGNRLFFGKITADQMAEPDRYVAKQLTSGKAH